MVQTAKWLKKARGGFTLVELAVVVVIIGVLAAFGVPRFLESVERSKASEAFGYLSAVRSAQERYQAREGAYTENVNALDIKYAPLKYFKYTDTDAPITLLGTSAEDGWIMSLTRLPGSSGYKDSAGDDYTVVFTHMGFLAPGTAEADLPTGTTAANCSTIPAEVNPVGGQPS